MNVEKQHLLNLLMMAPPIKYTDYFPEQLIIADALAEDEEGD